MNINKNDLKKFIKDTIQDYADGSAFTYYFELGNGLYYVMGLIDSDNFDNEDVKELATDETGEFVVCGKIAVNCDDLQCDYDYDWNMPYEEFGEVYDTETTFYKNNEDYDKIVDSIIQDFNHLSEYEIDDDGVIIKKNKNESKNTTKRDRIDANADNKKELAKRRFAKKVDDIDSDRDYKLKKSGLKESYIDKYFVSIEGNRDGYSPSQCGDTFTVGELIDCLSQYDNDCKVYLINDNGYTFGSISEYDIRERSYKKYEDIDDSDDEE